MTQDANASVNTGGGTYVAGSVTVNDGDFVGRDKIIGYSAEQIIVLLDQISKTFQPKPFDGRCPYVGLESFTEGNADLFFGRERLVGELLARLKALSAARFMAIAGPSGSGKSSLVRAGLLHGLAQSALPGSESWLYTSLAPGRNPLEQLALAAARLAKSPDAGDYLRRNGLSDPNALHKLAESLLSDRPDQRAVIFADQFEETFTQVSNEAERTAFINLLTQAATSVQGRTIVLVAMRSDFVGQCASYPQLNVLINQQFFQVGAMQPDELVSAIASPALRVGLRIDPDLVRQVANDMEGEPGALPLMQFALKDLFDFQQAKGGVIALTREAYLVRGGIHQSLVRHADETLAQLTPEQQALARVVFSNLIEVGRGTTDTRRTVTFDELIPAGKDPAAVEAVLQVLSNTRLVTTDVQAPAEAPSPDPAPAATHNLPHTANRTITLSHEKLITVWPWLQRLVHENREVIELQNRINEDAQAWQQNHRETSYLYMGARLETVREQLAAQKLSLSVLADAFVHEAVHAKESAQRRRQRLTRAVIGVTTAAALIFAGLAAWAFASQDAAHRSEATAIAQQAIAEHERNVSRSRELATVALSELGRFNVERAVLIALEANQSEHTFESEDALRRSLFVSDYLPKFGLGNVDRSGLRFIKNVQPAPDSKHILTTSDGAPPYWWNIETGESQSINNARGDCARLAPDGRSLVVNQTPAPISGTVPEQFTIVDIATGQPTAVLRGRADFQDSYNCLVDPDSVQFSPNGRYIVSMTSYSRTIGLWDVAARQQIQVLEPGQYKHGEPRSAWFSPDSTTLLVAHGDAAVLWDVMTGKPLLTFGEPGDVVSSARFSADGQWIVTTGRTRTGRNVRIWNAKTGEPVRQLESAGTPYDARFSPEGATVLTTSLTETDPWTIFDAATGQKKAVLQGSQEIGFTGDEYSRDGQRIVTRGQDHSVRVWNAFTGQLLAVLPPEEYQLISAQFTPDGHSLIVLSGYGVARVWAASGTEHVLIGHAGAVTLARFSADGQRVVTVGDDHTTRIWDVATGHETTRIPWSRVADVDASGRTIAVVLDDLTAHLWDVRRAAERIKLPGAGILALGLSPDGRTAATVGEDHVVRQWDATTGRTLSFSAQLPEDEQVESVRFSNGGTRIETTASKTFNKGTRGEHLGAVVHGWDASTGQVLPGTTVTPVAPAPSSHTTLPAPYGDLAVEADGNDAKVSHVGGNILAILRGHSASVTFAQFSPDGRYVVTASQDGTARVDFVQLTDLVALAKSRVPGKLECKERVEFLKEDIPCPTPTPDQ